MAKPKVFIETRHSGLPWTREGCNTRSDGKFLPHANEQAAQSYIVALKAQDDPMWREAEYRIVPSRRR
jgi:hypothetical protein